MAFHRSTVASPSVRAGRRALIGAVAGAVVVSGIGAAPAMADQPPVAPTASVAAARAVAVPSAFSVDSVKPGDRDPGGDYGIRVSLTQHLLRRWAPSLAVDGSFGPASQRAAKAFQRAEGLPVTGTLKRTDLYRLFVRQTVRTGSRGEAVRAVQKELRGRHSAKVAVDGSFGAATRAAVVKAQRAHGALHDTGTDGVVGPHTWAMFFEAVHESGC